MLSLVLVPVGAGRLVRTLPLVVLLAALAAAANPTWTEQQELAASDGFVGDQFGWSVSVSGDTAVIGAVSKNNAQGAAYVLVRSGGAWTQQQELTAFDGAADDYFGFSASVSGDTAVIGAWNKTINSQSGQGAAYVFVRSGGVWTRQQELTASDGAWDDAFGYSVSVSGDTAVIGAPGNGAAYVFVRSGGTWSKQQELTASDEAASDYFGYSVSVNGGTTLIGASAKNTNQGAAYVFVLSGQVWTQQQELTASDGVAGDSFGFSVSMSGGTAVIGAPGNNGSPGAAYGFALSGGVWGQQQKLTASDGAAGDSFGNSVSVSGASAVIAAYHKNADQGAAYLFALSVGGWAQQQELTASGGVAGDYFGRSVSVSGDTAAIGAVGRNNSLGAAYVFAVPQPTISAVISAGDFGGFPAVAPGTWVEIYGSELASTTRPWTAADFIGNSAPIALDGVQVTIAGQPAFIDYISPGQVNAQLPSNLGPGSLQLTVSIGNVTSAPVNVTVNATEAGMLAPPSFNIGGNQYVVAQFADGTYVLPAGLIAGVNSRPAQPGEEIVIYGIGFGSVVPDIPAGQIATGTSQLTASLQVLFGQTPAQQVPYAGLAPEFVGLYQFNVVVPAVPDNNLVPLTFNLGGVPGAQTLYTAVHQ
ncbi:MAG: hypothetical protein ABSE35_00315 [Bryobacteraceae bacterium]|jgi:uncharacterized protein (TIGR03437 family)